MNSEEIAKQWEYILRELIVNNSNIECDEDDNPFIDEEVDSVRTFEEASVCTTDRGIVIDMEDGSSVFITIQGYTN